MNIVVLGLGYVGCPLAYELSKHFSVIGFDINKSRVEELKLFLDKTNELTSEDLKSAKWQLSNNESCLDTADIVIVTVPTPITDSNTPDLGPVMKASHMIAVHMKKNATIIYESTVYPGVTEEICIPIIESYGHAYRDGDFHVAYSPERINPGDRVHTLTTTVKIVAGDSQETLDLVDSIYSKITKTYRAKTIKIAEAAKVIENTQRDVNIALMNELSQIFTKLDIDTNDVIDAALSKWNFLNFRPGLVGGHCISVDPYYLSHKAGTQGIITDVILSCREINDSMAEFIGSQTLQRMSINEMLSKNSKVIILGCTFKENVPDIRNSKVFDIAKYLKTWKVKSSIIDKHACAEEVKREYGVTLGIAEDLQNSTNVIIYAVPHEGTATWDYIMQFAADGPVLVIDVKGQLDRETAPDDVIIWRP